MPSRVLATTTAAIAGVAIVLAAGPAVATPYPQDVVFTDVPAGGVFADAISRSAEAGLVAGYRDGTFRPGGDVTALETMVVLRRYVERVVLADVGPSADGYLAGTRAWAARTGLLPTGADGAVAATRLEVVDHLQGLHGLIPELAAAPATGGIAFDDVDVTASPAVGWAASAGIVAGHPDGTFRPDASVSRGELVAIVDRYRQAFPPTLEGRLHYELDRALAEVGLTTGGGDHDIGNATNSAEVDGDLLAFDLRLAQDADELDLTDLQDTTAPGTDVVVTTGTKDDGDTVARFTCDGQAWTTVGVIRPTVRGTAHRLAAAACR